MTVNGVGPSSARCRPQRVPNQTHLNYECQRTCRRAASSQTSSLVGHSSQPFMASSRAWREAQGAAGVGRAAGGPGRVSGAAGGARGGGWQGAFD